METILHWLENLLGSLPLPLLEVWGRFAYFVGFALALAAFGGFTFRPGGRWGMGRERQSWDGKSLQSILITFLAIVCTGYIGSFIVLVPGAQTFESLKDLSVFLCVMLFGYPALVTVPFAYGLSDLIEGVPPGFLLDWLPGYFINPTCFWLAYQLFGKDPDFRRSRTWGNYLLFVLAFMSLEPVLWGYICSGKFTPVISYRNITSALFFTTSITWLLAPWAMLVAYPLAKRFGMFWAAIPGHVLEKRLGAREWVWTTGEKSVDQKAGVWPIRLVILVPFISLVLLMVGATAFVTLRSAKEDATKLTLRLHQEISQGINLQLDEYFDQTPRGADLNKGVNDLLAGLPVAKHGLALVTDHLGNIIASSNVLENDVAIQAIETLRSDGFNVEKANSDEFLFDHVTEKPLGRTTWLGHAIAYEDHHGGHKDWILLTLMPESYYLAGVETGNSQSAKIFAAALLLALVLAAFLATLVTGGLKRLSLATQAIARGDLSQRVKAARLEELNDLSQSFNHMADQLSSSIAARRESEDKYRNIFENIQDVFIRVDNEGRIQEASPSVERFIGYPREELIGRSISDLYWDPSDRALFVKAIEEKGEVAAYELRLRDRLGVMVHVSLNARQLRDSKGRGIGIEGLLRDITAQVKVRETQRRLAYILEQTADGVLVTDVNGIIVEWNKGAEKIFGYRAEEVLGKSGSFLNPGNESGEAFVKSKIQQASKGPLHFEEFRRRKDGGLVQLDINSSSLQDESGRIIGYSAIYRDITQQKKAQESQSLLALIMEQSPVAIILNNLDGTIRQWNKGAEKIFGYGADEVLGKMAPYITPEQEAEVKKTSLELSSGKDVVSYEAVRRRKNGQLFDISAIRFPLKDNQGEVVGFVGIVRDITEEQKARGSQRLLASILEQTPDGVILSDSNGIIRQWNKGAENIYGYKAAEIIGKTADLLALAGQEKDFEKTRRRLLEGQDLVRYEAVRRRKDGKEINVSTTRFTVKNDRGEVVGLAAIVRDVTESKKLASDLAENQERFRHIFEDSPLGVALIGLDSKLLLVNQSFSDITGYSPEEMKGKSFADFTHPEDAPRDLDQFRRMVAGEFSRYQLEKRFRHKDGHDVWVIRVAAIIKDEVGKPLYGLGMLMDITGRKKNEETQRFLTYLLEQTGDGIVVADLEGNIVQWNKGAEKVFGYKAEEVLGKPGRILDTDQGQGQVDEKRRAMREDGATHHYEALRKGKDGRLIQLDISSTPLKDESGRLVGYSAIYRDITEKLKAQVGRAAAEEKVRESEAKYRKIFENVQDVFYQVDNQGNVLEVSPSIEAYSGYTREEFIGKNFTDFYANPEDRTAFLKALGEKGEVADYELQFKTKSGLSVYASINAHVLLDEGGKPMGVEGSLRDITHRKMVQSELEEYREHLEQMVATRTEQLEKATKAADAANLAKSSFLANMSHEIRTPMNAILGFAQLLRRDPALTPEQDQQVGVILRSGGNLLTLINDILDYSKIEANRLAVEESNVDLQVLLKDLESMFKAKAKEKGLRLVMDRPEDRRYLVTDEGKLRQILQNLVSNALKFTEKGGVRVHLAVKPGPVLAGGDRLLVEVEDSGPGIAPDEMGKLFRVFEQTESGRKSKSGTGLGLAISRKFAELLGGSLEAESRLGRGSVFRLEIPYREGIVVKAPSLKRHVVGLELGQPTWKVMVVDDNSENRGYLESLLKLIGFETKLVNDGSQAVDEFEGYLPHLILMDLRMPVMDGNEANSRIRRLKGGGKVKIIAVSASVLKEDQKKAIEAGADDFLSKPFREEALFEKIQNLLGAKFQWADETDQPATGSSEPPPENMDKDRVARLPADLRSQLRQALLVADLDLALSILDRIGQEDAGAASALRNMAGNFEYQKILELLKIEGETHVS